MRKDEQVPPKDWAGGGGTASQLIPSLQRVSPMGMEAQSLHTSPNHGPGLREELTDYRRQVTQHPVPNVFSAVLGSSWGATEDRGVHN